MFIYLIIFSYIADCKFGCNGGECINNDLCDCTETNFQGKYCNEYIKLGRNILIDTLLITILLIIIFAIVILIGMTLSYRNNSIIKGGNN